MTIPEAAEYLGVTRAAVYGWIRRGDPIAHDAMIQVGRKWRVSRRRLERYLHGEAS